MRKIVHISDIHFGTVIKGQDDILIKDIESISPDVVVISGDLTQRARRSQYKDAAAFLKKIKFPYIVIPGNHDVPLFDILRRLISPFGRYKKYITDNMYPVYEDYEILILGINTARSLTWKRGRISEEQIKYLREKLCGTTDDKFKIVVTHHPFMPPPEEHTRDLVGRAEQAVEAISACGADLILAGHAHKSYSADIKAYYPKSTRSFIIAQAGTALSKRHRGEPNTYNIITVDKGKFIIQLRRYKEGQYLGEDITTYVEENDHWQKENSIR